MLWIDSRWGLKGRGIYILLCSPVLLYALYVIASIESSSAGLLVRYVDAGIFLLLTYLFISACHCVLVCLKTLQRAEIMADQCTVVLYFGKTLRFSRDDVVNVERFEKKSPRIWASPLSIDKTKPNYVVHLMVGEMFYISGVLPGVKGLVDVLGAGQSGKLMCTGSKTIDANPIAVEKEVESLSKSPSGRWKFMFYSSIFIYVIVIGFAFYKPYYFQFAEWSKYFPVIGVLSAFISVPLIAKYRSLEKMLIISSGKGDSSLKERLVEEIHTGSGIAEIPLFIGLLYYLFSADIFWLIILGCISLVIQWLYKPKQV